MYITRYSSYISENLKSGHSSYRSFMSGFWGNISLSLQNLLLYHVFFSAFYVFSLKFIFPLVLKILMSVKYE